MGTKIKGNIRFIEELTAEVAKNRVLNDEVVHFFSMLTSRGRGIYEREV